MERKTGGNSENRQGKPRKGRRTPLAALCSLAGTLALAALVLVCVPLALPRLFGFQVYTVVSGSMEPAIPTGSLVYVTGAEPGDIKNGEVIAFRGGEASGAVIIHRVTENRVVMGEFATKGDANAEEDMRPVPYRDFIGKVAGSVPGMGKAAALFASREGKAGAVCAVAAAVLLQAAASLIDRAGKGNGKNG